jgi:hypothetical protein
MIIPMLRLNMETQPMTSIFEIYSGKLSFK